MMTLIKCDNKCCDIKYTRYTVLNKPIIRKYKKSGGFIFDEASNKVLLIQSRGWFFGPPKGSIEFNETTIECAIREIEEETGLLFDKKDLTTFTKINGKATYYFLKHKVCNVNVRTDIKDNDVNSICWIKPECLNQMIKKGKIRVNKHCRILFKRFLNFTLDNDMSSQK